MELYVLIFLILCVVLLFIFLFLQLRPAKSADSERVLRELSAQREDMAAMQQQWNNQLMMLQTQISQLMKTDLQSLHENVEQRMSHLELTLNENLHHGYQTTTQVFGKVLQQMGKLDESQQSIKEVSASILQLQNILNDKKTRGIFGEIELYSLLETAMGTDEHRYQKQYKLSNGTIADAVLFASEPLRMICIDSKFPLENYNRLMHADTAQEKAKAHAQFVQDVKKHVRSIASKYILPQETAEFACMFLPAEAVFSYIYASCDEVVQYSYEEKVYMVSPTTLMAYLTAISAIYLGVQRNEHVEQIQQELKHLQVEFERFHKRYQTVGSDFERTYQDMRQLQITAGKIVKRFEEIQEVQLDKKENTAE